MKNLLLGGWVHGRDYPKLQKNMCEVFELFPILNDRQTQMAGTLSGGEQQMLVIGRSLMSNPKLLMLDEPSLGIAPLVVERIFEVIREDQPPGHHHPSGRAERLDQPDHGGSRLHHGDRPDHACRPRQGPA